MASLPKGGYGIIGRVAMRSPLVSRDAKAVYALMCSYTGDADCCFPSIETMAKDLKSSPASIKRYIAELIRHGFIKRGKKIARGKGAHNRVNAYWPQVLEPENKQQLTGEPMSQGLTDEPIKQLTDEPIKQLTDEPLLLTSNTNSNDKQFPAPIGGGKPKKAKATKARKNTYPAKEMAEIFEKGYPALHGGDKFPWGKQSGKWGKHFQISWELSGENMDKVREMAAILFRTIRDAKLSDTYWRRAGFTPSTLSSRWTQLLPVSTSASTLTHAVEAKPFPAYQSMTLEELETALDGWSGKWGLDVLKKHISPESFSRYMESGFAPDLPGILDRENRERVQQKIA